MTPNSLMKASKTCALISLLLLGTGFFFIVSRFTTYFTTSAIPRGILISRHVEQEITSGEVWNPFEATVVHFTPAQFVAVNSTVILHPLGVMPFHEPVEGTHFHFLVDSSSMSTKTLYLIDTTENKMFPIACGMFDLRGTGSGIGSTSRAVRDIGMESHNPNQIIIKHEDTYEIVEVVIDLEKRTVFDVRVARKDENHSDQSTQTHK